MVGFFWNVRGFNKGTKQAVVRKWCRDQLMNFGCLIETRVKEKKAGRIVEEVFEGWNLMANYEFNRLGRLWVVWRSTVRLTPVFKSAQIITCSVLLPGRDEEFFCSFIYAYNTVEERKELWEDLRNHNDAPMFKNKKWMLMGDFNEILESEEHSGFEASPRPLPGMRDFQEVSRYCRLSDMGYQGPLLTWCNKREDGLICKKLDRVLVNDVWLHNDPAYCVFEAGGCSDHMRCRIEMEVEVKKRRKPFKFTNVIGKMPEFLPLMEDQWKNYEALYQSTSAMFRLTKRLKALKQPLRALSKEKLGELSKRTREAYQLLCVKQQETMENPTSEAIREESEVYMKWQRLAEIEEECLKQKSKVHWLDVGDGNNKFFHSFAKIREVHNAINEIQRGDGTLAKTEDEIKEEAEGFFAEFMQRVPQDFEGATVDSLKELLRFQCSEVDCTKLEREITNEEIKEVVFRMPSSKSPGPDGFTSEFFKEAWPVIGADVVNAVQSFFTKGFLPKGLNSTILALIPKKEEARMMKDYRPISLCNVLYKVISKIIANRLKGIMPKCITLNQSAFVKGRLLMENVLLASELVKDYHREDISLRCAMQIDIAKAFDSVQWPFLLNTLQAMGFPGKFIQWISLCITSPSFSVQVNGELAGYFQSKRGLRQGCSLSPCLFVICMSVLSRMIDEAAGRGEIGYHPKCKNIDITHLCFADDLMVFTDGTRKSIEGILTVFDRFDRMSGLQISMEKSILFMAGGTDQKREEVQNQFQFASGTLPVRYLGLPLLTKRMTVNDYLPLIEKIRKRISSWTGRFLSYAGRSQLIQSVIMSLTNFWMAAFRLPSSCIKEIERICSAYLWSGPELNGRKNKIAWKDICKTKQEGGLGIRPLKEVNLVCCIKLIWRILSSHSLWVNWVQNYLIRKGSIWMVKDNNQSGTWMWRKILKCRDMAKMLYKVEVKDGNKASFWFEKWSSLGCLQDVLSGRGHIDLGILANEKVAACRNHRRRQHRIPLLNRVEMEIELYKANWVQEEDVSLWKTEKGKYKRVFSTRETWNIIREKHLLCGWHKAVWFKHATPRYSFILWTAIHGRLSTGDRLRSWNLNVDVSCGFCSEPIETRKHLFFECFYSREIWETLVRGVMRSLYTTDWDNLIGLLSTNSTWEDLSLFIVRHVFQSAVHAIWMERNRRRHGEKPAPAVLIVKKIDKEMRNKFTVIRRKGDKKYEGGMV